MKKCNVSGCICPNEAHPMVIESNDGGTMLMHFCTCHVLAVYAEISEIARKSKCDRWTDECEHNNGQVCVHGCT